MLLKLKFQCLLFMEILFCFVWNGCRLLRCDWLLTVAPDGVFFGPTILSPAHLLHLLPKRRVWQISFTQS